MIRPPALALLLLGPVPAVSDAPEIVDVTASESGPGWRFSVTLRHPDTGWEHYADGWRIETVDGQGLDTRELLHPHDTEQPFTRSLDGVSLPSGVTEVRIRAKCNMDGWSDEVAKLRIDR